MKLSMSLIVLSIVLLACSSERTSDLEPAIGEIIARLKSSKETEILTKPIRGQYFNVKLRGPIDSGAFLLVRSTEERSIRDYRYDIVGDSIIKVLTPDSAVNLQIGVVLSSRTIPQYASTTPVFDQRNQVVPKAVPPLIANADGFEQAMNIAKHQRMANGTTDALFAVLFGIRADERKKNSVLQEIRSHSMQSVGNKEIALAAEWMSDSSRKDHLVAYMEHLASKKRVEYPHVLARVLDETPVLANLTSSQIGLFAENVLARERLWSFATNLVYRINVGDRQECSKAGEIVRVFAREMSRFSPYEHVSLTSVTFTLAEIAYAAGDTSAAYRLLADVRDHTVHRASSYWKSSRDPYWVVDVRGWAHAARFLMARWRMKEGKDEEAYHVLRDYQLTQESDEDADIAFVRVVASLKSKRHKQLLTEMIVERVASMKGKSNLLEIARQQLGITTPELPANINDDSKDIVLIVTGPGCSVCESLIQYLQTTVSGQNTKASIVYDVSSQSIIFTNAKVVRLSESVKNACVRRTSAFPTVFIVRGDRIIREYKGSSVELMRTLLAQDKK